MPLVSTIITTYKRPAEMVLRAINSVLCQTHINLEIIIVDDSPNTFEGRKSVEDKILALEDKRIRYIKHEVNKGACAARNTGISLAQGEYIAFLDDDDVWYHDKLEKQLVKIKSDNYGLVYCRQKIINEINNTEVIVQKSYFEGMIFDELILTNFVGSTSFVLIKKECFDSVGMFDVNMPASQDFEMWLRIAKVYKIGFVDEVLVNYHIHLGESITGNYTKKLHATERILEKYSEYFKEHKKEWGIRLVKQAPYYAVNRNYRKAILIYGSGIKKIPGMIKFNSIYFLKCIRAAMFGII